ncbi:hypothetical protein TI39_contig627g00001 [Zymoseptoria brevis]|uniref:Only prolin and serin are matching in the corresponding protein n=1 Tax=Zymoseptoria brevis TaxID=1047168 RepID=A0A0F4GG75_9PEZI|nr:hypothetical protein TI39_contig627g00001 [Zymoseptoria brevis]
MDKMRPLSMSKINTSTSTTDRSPSMGSPYFVQSHSRDSSAGSSNASPITPTFSVRGHSRFPSSTSSLVTSPDSPLPPPPKALLHDLVEDPAERDECFEFMSHDAREEMCICDTPFCHHRQVASSEPTTGAPPSPEWTPGDDYFADHEFPRQSFIKRQRSEEDESGDSFSTRFSRHLPSIRKRFSRRTPSTSSSIPSLRSAPHPRSTSMRMPSTQSLGEREGRGLGLSLDGRSKPRSLSPPHARSTPQNMPRPRDSGITETEEEHFDAQELASTPLLPPMLADYFNKNASTMQSPLQSPTTAAPSVAQSMANSPVSTPVISGYLTPPLSTRGSFASLGRLRSNSGLQSSSEIPSLTIAEEETDPWAIKLGHANFQIHPEPYLPDIFDAQTCRRLRDDWETARMEYMRLAAQTSEHYGVTSRIYKLTEQKWSEIDATWRANHEMANAEAQAHGDSPIFQPLAETEALSKMPSLRDPQQPSKFPLVDPETIVGPMVRYAKIQHSQPTTAKRPSFLRIFTDPASMLTNIAVRR